MWAAHPAKRLVSEFESEVKAAPPQASEKAPVVDPFPNQCRSIDGRVEGFVDAIFA